MKTLIYFIVTLLTGLPTWAADNMSMVTGEIEQANIMRESLVGAVQGKVDSNTFRSVCKPVGERLKTFAKKNGFKVSQVSFKNRNKENTPNKVQSKILKEMEKDDSIVATWRQADGGLYYFRRIDVKSACLNCHGKKDSRPDFIVKKYPNDKAFGFRAGDLRGIYSVFLP